MSYEDDPGWVYLKYPQDKLVKEQSRAYDSKKNVWIPDDQEGFVAADIKTTKADMVTVVLSGKGVEKTLKKDLLQEMNPPKFDKIEDMSNLTFLNDASVLYNLRSRYSAMLIYTYSGLFCVVINPYKRLPIYTESVVKLYMGKRRNEMPPHLFAVSDEAYRNMLQDREHQSMLITGESGAGKTENTKKVIAYFATVGASQIGTGLAQKNEKQKATLEQQIVQTNPVLESFGNAKTVRNNNSSRFGKFIRVHFDRKGKMAGGDIEHYLLEKSRVIKQAPGERCYHIFYQIMSGQNSGLREKLLLAKDLKFYHFVSQAELTIDGVDDKEEARLTDEAFDILGFAPEEKDDVYKICAAIMHMGEMKFKQRPREEQAEVDDAAEAEKACAMFGVDKDEYLKAIMKPRVKVGNEWVNKGQNLEQVKWGIGAMAKGIYARMFHWLVKRCNETLSSRTDVAKEFFIGVLDIAGFEIFDFNSFEQLWINFVNEKLQQFFNHHMFVLEQEEYQREGINWTFIDFGMDLQACIELIEKPMGIISILDEECIVPKATDLTYAQKLNDTHLGKHPNFEKPKPPKGKQAEAHFAMKHYAGTVRYNVSNWLEKNKDPLNDTCVQVMKTQNRNKLVLQIWQDFVTQEDLASAQKAGKESGKKKGKSASFNTVSMMYRESLNNLMCMLHTTHPHFVRCIIPNELKKSGILDAALIMNQLTCNGVLEGIRICRKGFPNRLLHADFRQRYSILAANEAKSSADPKAAATAILKRIVADGGLTEENYKIGQTKVFFKAGILAQLEDQRDAKLSAIMKGLQAQIRWYRQQADRRKREEQKAGKMVIQRNVRGWMEVRQWSWFELYGLIQPLRKQGELDELVEKVQKIQQEFATETKLRAELKSQTTKIEAEKLDIFSQLASIRDSFSELTEKAEKLEDTKVKLQGKCNVLSEDVAAVEKRVSELLAQKKHAEAEFEHARKTVTEREMTLRRTQADGKSKEHTIRNLKDEMAQQDDMIARLSKESKHGAEIGQKQQEDLLVQTDKANHLAKLKSKLERSVSEMDDALDHERRCRQDAERNRRKVEGDVRIAQEAIDELSKQRQDLENGVRRKELEIVNVNNRLEDTQSLISKLQRTVKEMQARCQEFEAELEAERQARNKAERTRTDAQQDLEELAERLEDAGAAVSLHADQCKKRDAELSRLCRDRDESALQQQNQLSALQKKHAVQLSDMSEQQSQFAKQNARSEKEKKALQLEIEALRTAVDAEAKQKLVAERLTQQLELQVQELQSRVDDQGRQLLDSAALRGRLASENADLCRQVEDAEMEIAALSRLKQGLLQQVEEAKAAADEEAREKQSLAVMIRQAQNEMFALRANHDEEIEAKANVFRQVAKANADLQQWRDKYEAEGHAKAEELDDARRRLTIKIEELQGQLSEANAKAALLEKNKSRLLGEFDDAQVEIERANNCAVQLEKKQRSFEQVVENWKLKCDEARNDLDASQRENRKLTTEVFKVKNAAEEIQELIEATSRENRQLQQEIKDLTDQLDEGGRSSHDIQKTVRRLEAEKEELHAALNEAEISLEAEEGKVLRAQLEVNQLRVEIEKRVQEKEEEFENTKKNHQRALDSMQASLEAEAKSRAELLKAKKILETEINDLEIALDGTHKTNADTQKSIRRQQEQVAELQSQIEEEQRFRAEILQQFQISEKRGNLLSNDIEELRNAIEQVERMKRQLQHEMESIREQVAEASAQNTALTTMKRRLDGEMLALQANLEETTATLRTAEEQGRRAMADAAHLAGELSQEQERATAGDRARRSLDEQVLQLQLRLDEAEAAALKSGRKQAQKLEERVRMLEQEFDAESRKTALAQKAQQTNERRLRELQFEADEARKAQEKGEELVAKLQQKIKALRRQLDEADEVAATNLNKFRGLQRQLEDAIERSDVAENALIKLKCKTREVALNSAVVQRSQSLVVARSRTLPTDF